MKRYMMLIFIFISMAVSGSVATDFQKDMIESIKINRDDIPRGFVFGMVPDFARKVLKDNPWYLDKAAIKRLTKEIYPGGDFKRVSQIHATIMADEKTPYGDDLVCYIILYQNTSAANKELQKISDFTKFNTDRVILIARNNMAVFLHIDNVRNMPLLKSLAGIIEKRLEKIDKSQ